MSASRMAERRFRVGLLGHGTVGAAFDTLLAQRADRIEAITGLRPVLSGVLTRSGWTRHSLNPGDRVSVEFNPLRDGSHGGGLNSVTLLATGQKLRADFATSEKPELQ